MDYKLLEDNLRQTIKKTTRANKKTVLVHGDLCLGSNGEMKSLAEEYNMSKVDALNCTDCLLGGKGKILEVDSHRELLILHPGMIEFFYDFKNKLKQEGVDEDTFKNLFNQLKGVVLLDTLDEAEKNKIEVENLHIGLKILEVKKLGLEKLKQVISEATYRVNSR